MIIIKYNVSIDNSYITEHLHVLNLQSKLYFKTELPMHMFLDTSKADPGSHSHS